MQPKFKIKPIPLLFFKIKMNEINRVNLIKRILKLVHLPFQQYRCQRLSRHCIV